MRGIVLVYTISSATAIIETALWAVVTFGMAWTGVTLRRPSPGKNDAQHGLPPAPPEF